MQYYTIYLENSLIPPIGHIFGPLPYSNNFSRRSVMYLSVDWLICAHVITRSWLLSLWVRALTSWKHNLLATFPLSCILPLIKAQIQHSGEYQRLQGWNRKYQPVPIYCRDPVRSFDKSSGGLCKVPNWLHLWQKFRSYDKTPQTYPLLKISTYALADCP